MARPGGRPGRRRVAPTPTPLLAPEDPAWLRVYVVVMSLALAGLGVAIVVVVWRTEDNPLVLVGGIACGLVLTSAALGAVVDRLPEWLGSVLGIAFLAALLLFLVGTGLAGLFFPDQVADVNARRGPTTPGQARGYGVMFLAFGAFVASALFLGQRRDGSRSLR